MARIRVSDIKAGDRRSLRRNLEGEISADLANNHGLQLAGWIQKECRAIQATWSKSTERSRRVARNGRVEMLVIVPGEISA